MAVPLMGGHYFKPRTIDDIRAEFEAWRRLLDKLGPGDAQLATKALRTQGMIWYRDVELLLTALDELLAAFRSEGDTSSAKLFTGDSGGS